MVTFGHCRLELVAPENGRAASIAADPLRRTSIDIVADAAVADPMSRTPFPGGTLTIVFSDIEQSTRRTEELGDAAWLRLLGLHNSVVRRQLERHGGHEVKAQGDGFMLAFPSAAVRRAVRHRRPAHPGCPRPVPARGSVAGADRYAHRRGDHGGRRPLRALRCPGRPVAGQARGGEILVSSLVREIVESRGDLAFGETREAELKGLAGAHRLHPIRWAARNG